MLVRRRAATADQHAHGTVEAPSVLAPRPAETPRAPSHGHRSGGPVQTPLVPLRATVSDSRPLPIPTPLPAPRKLLQLENRCPGNQVSYSGSESGSLCRLQYPAPSQPEWPEWAKAERRLTGTRNPARGQPTPLRIPWTPCKALLSRTHTSGCAWVPAHCPAVLSLAGSFAQLSLDNGRGIGLPAC